MSLGNFTHVAKGTRAVKRVSFALVHGLVVDCGVRILLGEHDDAIETAARRAAVDRGVADPKEGNPIYDRWIRLLTLLYSVVDVPADPATPIGDDPPLFFDGGVEQIQHHLDRERIAWLYAMQLQWQALISPRPRNMNREEFAKSIYMHALAGVTEEELPFWRWHPGLQNQWLITTSELLMNSPGLRSAFGFSSEQKQSGSFPGSDGPGGNLFDADTALDEALRRGMEGADRRSGFVHADELPEHRAQRTGQAMPAPAAAPAPAPARSPARPRTTKRPAKAKKRKR